MVRAEFPMRLRVWFWVHHFWTISARWSKSDDAEQTTEASIIVNGYNFYAKMDYFSIHLI